MITLGQIASIMAQALSSTPPTADRPADYEITPDGVMRALDTWKRDDRATFARMMLVANHHITLADVAGWTDEQVQQADCWAFSTHLSASVYDDIVVPARPTFIPYVDRRVAMIDARERHTLRSIGARLQ